MTFSRLIGRILLVLFTVFVLYQLWLFAHVVWWKYYNPSGTAFMTQQRDVLQQKDAEADLQHQWVPYDQISPSLKRALVASEDAKFLAHEGFDWEGMQTAWEKNMKKGRIAAGGSTISQQLAKNLFLSGQRSYLRKLEEAAITLMLEAVMDKRRIFEIYLNVIEWGNGVFGAEAAARHYFNTSAAKLGAAQSAKLAAMVPNPRYYDKNRNARGLVRKAAIIERRMRYADIP
ncbi:monofunctional biosynthetic peptidoglycan transglycosylase [Chitinimonas sp. BJB300]|uniref:monofunctional biosynthetic peptidoglycan transglycosylase n=1 Tax=Chitinimonas sp. BJB300 TaxID=1559339 RepID=UPI000C0DE513|nr:monofunctional biosynthetic peptidoglycan transglycosylase [Chitinimonas sp. BJB300]PHV12739.1 monofunctional biosynthetic peptidoglycan transglycosylase [Chitinimonas sp. BJB300]TSJ90918.1 monofunctional biosynthetic peptidoglycan transglycosylase [Chitinimonas sp. BJB300]